MGDAYVQIRAAHVPERSLCLVFDCLLTVLRIPPSPLFGVDPVGMGRVGLGCVGLGLTHDARCTGEISPTCSSAASASSTSATSTSPAITVR